MRIDTHQHFWIYDPNRDTWITDNMSSIQRNFLPNDIAQTLKDNNFDGVVAVQASQSNKESHFLAELAQAYKMIKGVVGWVDLHSPQIDEYLDEYQKYNIIKGFRHVIEGEEDGNFLSTDEFLNGIQSLTKYDYTYDLLIRPRHYESTLHCVRANPNQKFMLDHIAKPPIKSQEFEEWALFIQDLSSYPNVYCKISGLATEADWTNWRLDHFTQYVDHVIKCFGKNRICYGSDWPVCLLASSYEQSIEIVQDKLKYFTQAELDLFWGLNAVNFYSLK
ncbi:amidohydrolase family protein [Sphingobacterium bovistauri]|uniref:Amidohydrolase family protein n=1 Tax=Sphingobacterium bovistauri TaxID=2781959 RepID=A0ABS7Z050_9SPHI|nr:amidohydrolase family protein [Sphingobacterium bovistauri]MCA5003548.1 amidohydrolase family protein [Sphingobacterium bovistauri]